MKCTTRRGKPRRIDPAAAAARGLHQHLLLFMAKPRSATKQTKGDRGRSRSNPRANRPRGSPPLVGIIMGSSSDWETMEHAAETLDELGIPYEVQVVSAHRTPDKLMNYASGAEGRGIEVIIAGAGGAAHLPGMTASKSVLPVLGVPVESRVLRGLDSLLSIVQMPAGVAVGTLAIGKAGAVNAALLAAQILGASRPAVRDRVRAYRDAQAARVLDRPDPRK